jgi:hypothetical protein
MLKTFSLRPWTKKYVLIPEDLERAGKWKKERKSHQNIQGRELNFLWLQMRENLKDLIKNLLEIINSVKSQTQYIYMQNSAFQYIYNKLSEKEIKKTVLFMIGKIH